MRCGAISANKPPRRRIAVLRPEPGNAATCARIRAAGREAIALPLFRVVPLAWVPPDPRDFDALILTSANAVRHGGDALGRYATLPVHAVGAETARAATVAGLSVVATGGDNAAALLDEASATGVYRALHLGGAATTITTHGVVAASIAVYASDPVDVPPKALAQLLGATALLHSTRAAARLAALIPTQSPERASIALSAISAAVAAAAGDGWAGIAVAMHPNDTSLIAAAD
ncbi:MAG: uroporphyrinogen-III synthase [Sphingomonas sp.]|nr:uroporphyrinogen-III synthase [Sphingomonas sp.]